MNFDDSTFYAFVVDGEVAHVHAVSNNMEKIIAVMNSNPTIIKIPNEIVENLIDSSSNNKYWTYVNGYFNPPENS